MGRLVTSGADVFAALRVCKTEANNLGQGEYEPMLNGQGERVAEPSSTIRPNVYCILQLNR